MIDLRRLLVAALVLVAMILCAVRLVRIAIVIDAILLLVVALAAYGAEVIAAVVLIRIGAEDIDRGLVDLYLVAVLIVVLVAVATLVGLIDGRCIVVEELAIAIDRVYAEVPGTAGAIDRTIEVVERHELGELTSGEHVAHILVAVVEQAVIGIDSIAVAIDDVVHDALCGVDEVEVDLVAVIILCRAEIELVGHTIADETCMGADVAQRHTEYLSGQCHHHQC